MVLASNEWLNFCDDDQKSANNTTTTTTNNTTATATTNVNQTTTTAATAAAAAAFTEETSAPATTTTTSSANANSVGGGSSGGPTTTTAITTPTQAAEAAAAANTTTTTTPTRTANDNAKRLTANTNTPTTTTTAATTPNKLSAVAGGVGSGVGGLGGGLGVVTDNANNEAFLEYQQQQQQQQHNNKPPPPTYEEVLLLNTANSKIMADNSNAMIKNELMKNNETTTTTTVAATTIISTTAGTALHGGEDGGGGGGGGVVAATADNATNVATTTTTTATTAATPTAATNQNNELVNNNQEQPQTQQQQQHQRHVREQLNTSFLDDDDCLNENESESVHNVVNSNSNSNTNTLQPSALQRHNNKSNAQQQQQQLSRNAITSQALTNALQSVMSATAANINATTTTAAATTNGGIDGGCDSTLTVSDALSGNNFLSAFNMGGLGSMSNLQPPTAKQFAVTFCMSATTNSTAAAAANDTNLSAPTYVTCPTTTTTTTTTSSAATAATPASSSIYDDQQLELNNGNGQARIVLYCDANSHPFQTRTIQLTPNIECKVGRLIAKSKAAESNAIFDCKVLSRNHAVLWYSDDGKFWVKDTKSSNGTFINDNKLGTEAAEIHFGDIVKFGVDVLENSRKEVHGCIIACVKLYLPDGREAISIDAAHQQRSQYSGEGRVSFDELHRLNLYMQEAAQREKVLKSKLFNIQNVLDATRKNSALCWQSMIAEDQLLHRINSLEKKLQMMEKNVPESTLRNEVLKLIDEKSTYQHTAKETLRKVYQERCDAMQMLKKMEFACTTSDNECKILRDQIMHTKQSLQDVNTRLLRLESEYNDYKDECERQKQEAKEMEEEQTQVLLKKLKQYELECEQLRRKIAELLLKRAEQLDAELLATGGKNAHAAATGADGENAAEQAKLERQAIEKLDAAIADMDLGDDEDEDDADDVEEDDDDDEADAKGGKVKANGGSGRKVVNGIGSDDKDASPPTMFININTQRLPPKEAVKNKVVKESTIMKWLQNSDLNKDECSLDIFKAICNESDSGDEHDTTTNRSTSSSTTATTTTTTTRGAGANAIKSEANANISNNNNCNADDFEQKCTKFTSKLQSVQKNLKQLEAEIESETSKAADVIANLDDGSQVLGMSTDSDDEFNADLDDEADDEFIMKRTASSTSSSSLPDVGDGGGSSTDDGKIPNSVLSKENKNYILLKHSVSMLREAYNEICNNIQQQQLQNTVRPCKHKEKTPPPAISVQTQFQTAYSPTLSGSNSSSSSAVKKFETQETLKPLAEVNSDEENDSEQFAKQQQEEAAAVAAIEAAVASVTGIGADDDDDDDDNGADADDDDDDFDDISDATSSAQLSASSQLTIRQSDNQQRTPPIRTAAAEQQKQLEQRLNTYEKQVLELQEKLELNENDSQNTLEIMQIECDAFKDKVNALTNLVDVLRTEKQTLQTKLAAHDVSASNSNTSVVANEQQQTNSNSNSNNNSSNQSASSQLLSTTDGSDSGEGGADAGVNGDDVIAFDQQLNEELAILNCNSMEREEELIMYKERLEQMQNDNLHLRNEIAEMQRKSNDYYTQLILKRMLPYGVAVIAIVVYFLSKYF